jgi:hypothetical protein
MAKKPSLTKTLAEAAFYQAWFTDIPELNKDSETYNRTFERYLNRFSKMPDLALKTIARAAAAEANRSIEAYERIRPLPASVKAPIKLPADGKALADLIARYKAKSR